MTTRARRRLRLLLGVMSAAMLSLAFSPGDLWWLAPPATAARL